MVLGFHLLPIYTPREMLYPCHILCNTLVSLNLLENPQVNNVEKGIYAKARGILLFQHAGVALHTEERERPLAACS